ncbi:unnamed protein product, partial [Ectocarpus fasciculatus]
MQREEEAWNVGDDLPSRPIWKTLTSLWLGKDKFGSELEGVPPHLVEHTTPTAIAPPETQRAAPLEIPHPQRIVDQPGRAPSYSLDLRSHDGSARRLGDLAGPWASSTSSLLEPEGRFMPRSPTIKYEGPVMALALGLPGRVWAILGSRSPPAVDGEDRSFSIHRVHFSYTLADQTLTRSFSPGDGPPESDVLVRGSLSARVYETAKTLLADDDATAGNTVLREVLVFER